MEGVGKTCVAASAGVAVAGMVQMAATAAVPTAMAYFGTVVYGLGTIHAAGGVAGSNYYDYSQLATLQALGSAYLLGPVGITGAVVGVAGYAAFQVLSSQR